MRKLPSGESGVEMLAAQLGERLKELLRQRRMTIRGLATTLELPAESIKAYVQGTRLPRTYTLLQIAKALSVSAGDLLDEKPQSRANVDMRSLKLCHKLSELPDYERGILLDFFEPCTAGFEFIIKMELRNQDSELLRIPE